MSTDRQRLWIGNMVWRKEISDTLKLDREGPESRRVGGMLTCSAGNKAVAKVAMLKNQGEAEGIEVSGKTSLVPWDAATGKQSKIVEAPMALTIERSPDGKWIAEGGNDERIRDAQTLSVVREIRAQDAPVEGLKWHHSKSALVSTGSDQWIRIWTPETGQLLEEFRRVDLSPEGLDISGDGRQLGVGNGAANATEISLPQSFAR